MKTGEDLLDLRERKFETGSNGYYFVDGFHVDKAGFDREWIKYQLNRIEEKVDKLLVVVPKN